MSDDHKQLKEFYAVETDSQLIVAMQHHIAKLQEKLRKLQPLEAARSVVREG